VTSYANDSKQE